MGKLADDVETAVSVTFWDDDKCIFSFWSNIYPAYRSGDEILIEVEPTPTGMAKFQNLKRIQEFRIIDKVSHGVHQSIHDGFSTFLKLEVHLKSKES